MLDKVVVEEKGVKDREVVVFLERREDIVEAVEDAEGGFGRLFCSGQRMEGFELLNRGGLFEQLRQIH